MVLGFEGVGVPVFQEFWGCWTFRVLELKGSDKPASHDRGPCRDLMHNIRRVKGVGFLMMFKKPDNQATLVFK